MKTILVTGGAGFIGSNFVKMMVDKYPDYNIINLDSLTYVGNLENFSDIDTASNSCIWRWHAVRDWLHVSDHCTAIDKVLHHKGKDGEVYNTLPYRGINKPPAKPVVMIIINQLKTTTR